MKPSVTTIMFLITLFVLSTMAVFAQVPVNDECSGAIVVNTVPYSFSQDTRTATHNISDPVLACADGGGGKTVWYTFTPETTKYYTISSRNSTPSTYDIAFGLYSGDCNNLSLVDCNDDINPGSTRQAELSDTLYAGVTYYIHVAEWKGGGPSGGVPTGGDLVFEVFQDTVKALYKGPFAGSVASGAIANTSAMMNIRPVSDGNKEIENRLDAPLIQTKNGVVKPTGKAGSNLYRDDLSKSGVQSISQPVALQNFKSMNSTGFIPPDPICAVGPNHVITMANSNFRIYTKDGTLQREISLDTWFSNVRSDPGFSDPQVLYDHYTNRWVMGGGGFNAPYSILIAVSDDDDPNGTWTNWSLPATIGNSVADNFPDYPQMGYDEQAIYFTTQEFNPGLIYNRIRIIPKADLYAGGAVTWNDLYDLREPDHRNVVVTGLRPSMIYGAPGVHFFVNASPYNPGTFLTSWILTDPITSPVLTAKNVPIVEYYGAPNADQKDGSGTLIEAGGSVFRHKAVYRDSSIWVAHSIANDSGSLYSAVRYIRYNPYTGVATEDAALGLTGYWHYYPVPMVDGDNNLVIAYSMSSVNDYPGVWMTGRKDTDPAGLSPSVVVKSGDGHYEVVGSGTRNRWGDYSGAGLDPEDSLSIWITAEYASGPDVWGLWTARTKLSPVDGKYLYSTTQSRTFSIQEVGTTSSSYDVMLRNFGSDPVEITSITQPSVNFSLPDLPTLPVSLATGDTLIYHIAFNPQDTGTLSTVVSILSDDNDRSPMTFNATGTAFHVVAAQPNAMYATSGTNDGGKVYNVNALNGSLSVLGSSGYNQILSLRVHPTTKIMYCLIPSGTGAYVGRVNSDKGDAHPFPYYLNLTNLKGMEFLNDSILYIGRINGKLHTYNLNTGVFTEIATTGLIIAGLAINPVTHELWVSSRNTTNSDRIYKVALPSGTSTLVGSTGFGQQTQDIVFDANGNLFGLIGSSNQTNRLILIDTLTGAGTLVGSMARSNIQAIAIDPATAYTTGIFRLKSGWNMVSLPLGVSDPSIGTALPSATTEAFSYQGTYSSTTSLLNGVGYWIKYPSAKVQQLIGTSINVDTIPVRARWNMIGSVSMEIPTGAVFPIPPVDIVSSYYWYNPDSGYTLSSTVTPGKSYWVKTDTSGEIILNYTLASKNVAGNSLDLGGLNSLRIQDASHRSQSLYFGNAEGKTVDMNRYELPPAPPAGLFDARFTSNSMVALRSMSEKSVEFPIHIESKEYPVTIAWNIVSDAGVKYSIVVTDESGKHSTSSLANNSTVTLTGADSRVKLVAEEHILPTAFALKQNYPNPFNPTTLISYELPVDAVVRLTIFDVLGREVATLVNEEQKAGVYNTQLDASGFASGVYFYQLTAEPTTSAGNFSRFQSISKMLLMK